MSSAKTFLREVLIRVGGCVCGGGGIGFIAAVFNRAALLEEAPVFVGQFHPV